MRITQLEYGLTVERPVHVASRKGVTAATTYFNVHAGIEVGIFLAGQEERIFADVTLPMSSGDVWLAAMWELHGGRGFGTASQVVVVTFLPEFLGEVSLGGTPWLNLFAVPAKQRPRAADEGMRARVVEIGKEIRRESEERALGWEEAVRLNLLRLLLTLRRGWEPPRVMGAPSERGSRLRRVMPVLAASYVDPAAHISLAEAAAQCGLSASHFARLFRETMGLSYSKFSLRARVTAASQLLLGTEMGVQAVAEQSGFVDASHLHRNFVRHYGCTPAEYRRRFRERQGE